MIHTVSMYVNCDSLPDMAKTQRERSEATRRELIAAARPLFGGAGYGATKLEAIVAATGLTKGALYHHFDGKRALFRAVFEAEHAALAGHVVASARRKRDPLAAFYEGCRAFFDAVLAPDVQRIALIDGVSVLGWEQVREIESRTSLALIRAGLERAIDDGCIARRPVEPLAHFLFGGLCASAIMAARSSDSRAMSRQVLRELKGQLESLRTI